MPTPDTPPHDVTRAAVALLHALSGPTGIHASASPTANYRAVFTRDAVMAGTAGLLLDDAVIVASLVRTLDALRMLQGAEGQIASNYEIVGDAPAKVSFGTLAPRIDSTTWYLVGVALAGRAGAIDPAEFRESVGAVVRLLDALEYNGRHLVYVPTGGNWADEYVYEGYVLYDQVLRAWALRLLGAFYRQDAWTEKSSAISRTIATQFRGAGDGPRHPIAAFTPAVTRDVFDLAAVALLALSDTAPALATPALDWLSGRFLDRGDLPPAFDPVIDESHPDWPALSRYHLHGFRNRPHEYHNGGVWPIWIGWLALALGRAGRPHDLATLRAITAPRLGPDFAFEEYWHGLTHAPLGTAQMAYSATGVLFLHAAGGAADARLFDAPRA